MLAGFKKKFLVTTYSSECITIEHIKRVYKKLAFHILLTVYLVQIREVSIKNGSRKIRSYCETSTLTLFLNYTCEYTSVNLTKIIYVKILSTVCYYCHINKLDLSELTTTITTFY